jgi:hypothetical protein
LADADDVGVRRVVSYLHASCAVTWWSFGAREASVTVDADKDSFCLGQFGVTLRSADFARADLVVYKRRWLQPKPLVVSELSSAADRQFSEREWTSLLEGLLLAEEHRSDAVWLNPPSSWALTSNKLALLLRASRLGLDVPRFTVSTTIQMRDLHDRAVVAKAISADEVIDSARYFATARLYHDSLQHLNGQHLSTPSLLQDYVTPVRELRSYYILGRTITIVLTPSPEHVDIRYVPAESMAPTFDHLPAELDAALCGLARTFNLNYCAFDLLVPVHGDPMLIDITPAGSWDYFESEDAPFISNALGAVIKDHVMSAQGIT